MLILADNDVGGAVATLRRVLQSAEWSEFYALLDLRFIDFADLGMPRDAPDLVVWQTCQEASAVLVTANRAGGTLSLQTTIDQRSGPDSLPVITLADPQRILRDALYAEEAAFRLLDYLERMPSLRGTGRLFIP
jgi:hypothetical protein